MSPGFNSIDSVAVEKEETEELLLTLEGDLFIRNSVIFPVLSAPINLYTLSGGNAELLSYP